MVRSRERKFCQMINSQVIVSFTNNELCMHTVARVSSKRWRTYPWPEVHPFPNPVPKPTRKPVIQKPKLDKIGKYEDWTTNCFSIAKLWSVCPTWPIIREEIRNTEMKRSFHSASNFPIVFFGLTTIEPTIPELPRMSPFPSNSIPADNPGKSFVVCHLCNIQDLN